MAHLTLKQRYEMAVTCTKICDKRGLIPNKVMIADRPSVVFPT